MALYSLQIEKHVLGGLIQNPSVVSDVDGFLGERDFVAEPHNVIFSCLRSAYLNNEKLDKVLLAQKIKNLGISFKDKIDIFDYIESISFTPINPKATIKACQELAKLRAFRDIESTCDRMKEVVNKSVHLELEEVVSTVDAIYGDQINAFSIEDEPDEEEEYEDEQMGSDGGSRRHNESGIQSSRGAAGWWRSGRSGWRRRRRTAGPGQL